MYVCDFGLVPLDKSAYAACPVINSNSNRRQKQFQETSRTPAFNRHMPGLKILENSGRNNR